MPQFTAQTAAHFARRSHKVNRKAKYLNGKQQAVDIQAGLHKAGQMLSEDLDNCTDKELRARIASSLASTAKGWQSITDTLRILRGIPSPGSLRPSAPATKKQRAKATPIESPPEAQEQKPKESL